MSKKINNEGPLKERTLGQKAGYLKEDTKIEDYLTVATDYLRQAIELLNNNASVSERDALAEKVLFYQQHTTGCNDFHDRYPIFSEIELVQQEIEQRILDLAFRALEPAEAELDESAAIIQEQYYSKDGFLKPRLFKNLKIEEDPDER